MLTDFFEFFFDCHDGDSDAVIDTHDMEAISFFSNDQMMNVPYRYQKIVLLVLIFSILNCQGLNAVTRIQVHNSRPKPSPVKANMVSTNTIIASFLLSASLVSFPLPASSYIVDNDVQGIGAVTQSKLGESVRGAVIGGAQIADTLDLKWERFSDSLRDEKKCDPRTNRRMFDNGTRKDGTKIGNPVLGALCTPEPLRSLDEEFATRITQLAEDAMVTNDLVRIRDRIELTNKQIEVKGKVGPAFDRAAVTAQISSQEQKRQNFNRDLYIQMRAYGEMIPKGPENFRSVEKEWGNKMLTSLAPNANRNDYTSPFPKPDPTDDQPYNESSLLDALGGVSIVLKKLQEAGLIGHWEISIPEDDYWNVVTIAVDDDITIGGQILARETKSPLSGSSVVAVVRAAMEDQARIPYKMDTFFIDPTTTRQEDYNPTQLLISLSDLGQ